MIGCIKANSWVIILQYKLNPFRNTELNAKAELMLD
jgi:hypothetical protein